jgi:raffinose/stachyose/melibiose transport system permease protein
MSVATVALARPPRRARADAPGEPRLLALAYIAPALVAMCAILILPLCITIGLSFISWDGVGPMSLAGLDNYSYLLSDPAVVPAMENAARLTLFYSVLPIIVGFFVAAALARTNPRLLTPFRAFLFLPAIIAPVVVAIGWRLIYTPTNGVLDQLLGAVGINQSLNWLGSFDLALPSTGVVASWMEYGLVMVLFLAGIQNIPAEIYDAARVDGAGILQEFRHITLPGLRNELVVAVVVTVIASFRNFDLVYNLTHGGPGSSTTVPVLEVYREAFIYNQEGQAAALGVTITTIILVLTSILFVTSRRFGLARAA